MSVIDDVRTVVGDALQLGERADAMTSATPLLGAIPELDSMAVATLITSLEERFGFTVADDEIDGSAFQTVGTLVEFVNGKLSQ